MQHEVELTDYPTNGKYKFSGITWKTKLLKGKNNINIEVRKAFFTETNSLIIKYEGKRIRLIKIELINFIKIKKLLLK